MIRWARTRETVAVETPARAATFLIVTAALTRGEETRVLIPKCITVERVNDYDIHVNPQIAAPRPAPPGRIHEGRLTWEWEVGSERWGVG